MPKLVLNQFYNEKRHRYKAMAFCCSGATAKPESVQALNIAGQRLDVLVAEFLGHIAHGHGITIVIAITFTKVGQLLGDVVRILAAQLGVQSQVQARTVRRVATATGRYAVSQLAATEQGFAMLNQLG